MSLTSWFGLRHMFFWSFEIKKNMVWSANRKLFVRWFCFTVAGLLDVFTCTLASLVELCVMFVLMTNDQSLTEWYSKICAAPSVYSGTSHHCHPSPQWLATTSRTSRNHCWLLWWWNILFWSLGVYTTHFMPARMSLWEELLSYCYYSGEVINW